MAHSFIPYEGSEGVGTSRVTFDEGSGCAGSLATSFETSTMPASWLSFARLFSASAVARPLSQARLSCSAGGACGELQSPVEGQAKKLRRTFSGAFVNSGDGMSSLAGPDFVAGVETVMNDSYNSCGRVASSAISGASIVSIRHRARLTFCSNVAFAWASDRSRSTLNAWTVSQPIAAARINPQSAKASQTCQGRFMV